MIKIVITRPAEGARGTIELAERMGFSAISFPLLELKVLNDIDIKRPLTEYDWLLFTSSNAVRFFIDHCGKNKISLSQLFQIAAVGPSTEKTLNSFGLKANFVPNTYNRTAISEQMPVNNGDTILYPTLLNGPTRIESILKKRDCITERLDIYNSAPIFYQKERWQDLSSEKPDVLTFFSPRTVQAFFENDQQSLDLKDYVIAVLAESSAVELIRFGYSAQIKTDIPTAENLLQKIKEFYA